MAAKTPTNGKITDFLKITKSSNGQHKNLKRQRSGSNPPLALKTLEDVDVSASTTPNSLRNETSLSHDSPPSLSPHQETKILKIEGSKLDSKILQQKEGGSLNANTSKGPIELRPIEAPLKIPPAYQRFESLAKTPQELPLPNSFELLNSIFIALDVVCSYSLSRSPVTVFHKIQKPLENVLKRNVSMQDIKLISLIHSDLYNIKNVKINNNGKKVDSLQLELNRLEDQRTAKSLPFDAIELSKRKSIFRNKLLEFVHHEHFTYLMKNNILVEAGFRAKVWHPDFDLNSVALPLIEFDKCTDSTKSNKNSEEIELKLPEQPLTKESNSPKKSLLNRIREKEKKAKAAVAVPDLKKTEVQDFTSLSSFARILLQIFVSLKKNVLFLKDVVEKMRSFSSFVSEEAISENLAALCEKLPEWIAIVKSSGLTVIRIDKSKDLSKLLTDYQNKLKNK